MAGGRWHAVASVVSEVKPATTHAPVKRRRERIGIRGQSVGSLRRAQASHPGAVRRIEYAVGTWCGTTARPADRHSLPRPIMRPPLSFTRRAASILLPLLTLSAAGCLGGTDVGTPSDPATETFAPSLGVNISQMTKISNDLYIQDVVNGTGAQAASGKTLSVTYTGW